MSAIVSRSARPERSWHSATLTVLALLCAARAGEATTYSIVSLADGVAADGACTLREAIRAANTNAAVNECAAGGAIDTIALSLAGTYPFALGQEMLDGGSLTLQGVASSPGARVIDLGDHNRFLALRFGATLVVEGLTIADGNAFDEVSPGGGVLRVDDAGVTLRDLLVRSSRADFGGAVYASLPEGREMTIERVTFLENLAGGEPSSNFAAGGAMLVSLGGTARMSMRDARFESNRAVSLVPDAFAEGGSLKVQLSGQSILRVSGSSFLSNECEASAACRGGAFVLDASGQSDAAVEDSRFEDNGVLTSSTIEGNGDALHLFAEDVSQLAARRLSVVGNGAAASLGAQVRVSATGSALAVLDSLLVAGGSGDGIVAFRADSATVLFGQITASGNADTGLCLQSSSTAAPPPRVENSILWGNLGAADFVTDGEVDADQDQNHLWIGNQGVGDPLFVDAANGNYSLQALSGAVDAGEAGFASVGPFDLNHAPRVVGVEVDLGALERGGIFGDGFESAGTGAWSATVP